MFTDLIKGKKPAPKAKKTKKDTPEISDARLDELMDRLFSKGELEEEFDIEEEEEEEMDKGDSYFARKAKKAREEMVKGNEEDEDEEEEDEDEEEEDKEEMSKGVSKKERRAMMSKVYSMVDDLSDKELEAFLASRQVKKAMVMGVFNQMQDQELRDFVNSDAVNGMSGMQKLDKGQHGEMDKAHHGEMDKGDMMDMDKAEDPNDPGRDIRSQLAQIEKNLSMYGFTG